MTDEYTGQKLIDIHGVKNEPANECIERTDVEKKERKKLGLTFMMAAKLAQAGEVNVEEVVDSSFNPNVCLLPHQIAKAQSFAEETDTHIYTDRDIGFVFLDLEHILKVYKELRYDGENLNEDFSLFDWIQKI